jgi:CRISPR/Cas system CSM-associated protein Csm3 (group 7 of RAMP superfamily)
VVAVIFEITFHTPFRIASGHAGDGSDITVDPAALLPASSLKGLMRSAARDLLKFPPHWVKKVFGTGWDPSPWSWSDARVIDMAGGGDPEIRARARIRIEAETSTVTPGALLIADEVLAARAEFSIDRTGWIEPDEAQIHETVLLAAARAVTAVGGDRRRGLGWVTVISTNPAWSQEHLVAAIEMTRGSAPADSDVPAESGVLGHGGGLAEGEGRGDG